MPEGPRVTHDNNPAAGGNATGGRGLSPLGSDGVHNTEQFSCGLLSKQRQQR